MSISLVFLAPDLGFHLPFPLAYLFAENLILEAGEEGHTIRGEPQNLYERKVGMCEKSLIEDWDITRNFIWHRLLELSSWFTT